MATAYIFNNILVLVPSFVVLTSVLISNSKPVKLNAFLKPKYETDHVLNLWLVQITLLKVNIAQDIVSVSQFLTNYFIRNENIWVDGFLFDFLQKKTADSWVRGFVVYTGFLFSECLVFDAVVRIYLDNLIWPLHTGSISESNNVSEMIVNIIFFYLLILVIAFSTYIIHLA